MKKTLLFLFLFLTGLFFSQTVSNKKHDVLFHVISDTLKNKQKTSVAILKDSTFYTIENVNGRNRRGGMLAYITKNGDVHDATNGIVGNIGERKITGKNGVVLGYVYSEYGYVMDNGKTIVAYFDVPINTKIVALMVFFGY